MEDRCIKRRLLFACRETYSNAIPDAASKVGWTKPPSAFKSGSNEIDYCLVGRVPEGILLAFRGTVPPFRLEDEHESLEVLLDWLNDADLISHPNDHYPGRVHGGFAKSVDGLWPHIEAHLRALLSESGPKRLFVTGHSKGGALANLAAWRAREIAGLERPIRVVTVAAARVGDTGFRTAYEGDESVQVVRYESALDLVPLLPPGGDTPAFLMDIAKQIAPALSENIYVPVGTRMRSSTTWLERFAAGRRYLGTLGFGRLRQGYMSLLADAHSIDALTEYDRLICDGDAPTCLHN